MTKRPLSRQWEIPSQFHDISLTVPGTPAHAKCYSYHDGTSVIVSGGGYKCNSAWSESKMKCTSSAKSRMDSNMQLTINSFRQVFPDTSLTFSKIPDISLTAVKFPDISRQVVTLKWRTSLAKLQRRQIEGEHRNSDQIIIMGKGTGTVIHHKKIQSKWKNDQKHTKKHW